MEKIMKQLFKTALILTLFFSSIVMLSSESSYALKEIRSTTADLARSADGVVLADCVKSESRIDEDTGLITELRDYVDLGEWRARLASAQL